MMVIHSIRDILIAYESCINGNALHDDGSRMGELVSNRDI
jgi:hypothetical protein